MGNKKATISRDVNGIFVEQKIRDGFVNATAMTMAYGKDVSDWLKTDETFELVAALAFDLSLISEQEAERFLQEIKTDKNPNSVKTRVSASFPSLVLVKRGSPANGGGTWVHPDLAVQLAQWCNKLFAIQVSRWIREWWSSSYNPNQLEADLDRVNMRDELKDKKRVELTGQVKAFLVRAGTYNPKSKETSIFFGRVHNEVNLVLTGEKASAMRARLELILGKKVSESELLRDYFPMIDLANYAALCQAAANNMVSGVHPIDAVRLAAKQVLPMDYAPNPIDFTERIGLVRRRLEQRDQLLLKGA